MTMHNKTQLMKLIRSIRIEASLAYHICRRLKGRISGIQHVMNMKVVLIRYLCCGSYRLRDNIAAKTNRLTNENKSPLNRPHD